MTPLAIAAEGDRHRGNDPVRRPREAAVVERELHEGFCRAFGSAPAEAAAIPPSPTRAQHTHYLLTLAHSAPRDRVAALLPRSSISWGFGKPLLEVAGQPVPGLERHLR